MGTTAVRPTPAEIKRPLPATRLGRGVFSDEQLARMVHDGDPVVFSTLYERYRVPLSRYCRSILHHPDDAADAFQNTMMAALVGLERELPSGPLRPWLYRIAHNESIDLLRRRKPNVELVAEIPPGYEPSADPAVDEELQALLGDLRVLPERQRGALLMRELAGLEYDQIGRCFDTSAVAARKLVYEARVTLGFMRDGRDASCELICRQISDGDGRTLRNRTVRAHIDSCAACSAFERSLHSRREQLALVPALPLAGGGIWLATSIGGGAGATKALAGGTAVAGGAMAGTSAVGAGAGATAASGVVSTFGGALAVKCLAVCSALAVAGAGAAMATHGTVHHGLRAAHRAPLAVANVRSAATAVPSQSAVATNGAAGSRATRQPTETGASASVPLTSSGTNAAHGLHPTPSQGTTMAAGSGSGGRAGDAGRGAGTASAATGSTTAGTSSSATPGQSATSTTTPSSSTSTATHPTPGQSASGQSASGQSASGQAASGQSASGTSKPSAPAVSAPSATAGPGGGGASASQTSSTSFAEGIERLIDAGMQAASGAAQTESSIATVVASSLGGGGIPTAGSSGTSGAPVTNTSAAPTSTTPNASPVSGFFSVFSKTSN